MASGSIGFVVFRALCFVLELGLGHVGCGFGWKEFESY